MSKASKIAKKAPTKAPKTASKPEAPKAKRATKVAEPAIDAKAEASEAPAKREGKGALILRLISREQGATLAEIMSGTNWLAHSVRGFISTASKKRVIESRKNEAGDRTYKLVE